ncbi:MAG TPA: beta-ketoacyl synthase chain length factor [Stellaceae bacterium]|nr:beta-ketoacyl synthase chain length factor [Stellaceae bacterium]
MNEGSPVLPLWPGEVSGAAATSLRFRVEDWAACRVLVPNQVEWSGAAIRAAGSAAPPALPVLLRRRVSAIGQRAFEAASRLSASAEARFVFCSRHGEYRRTQGLLEALAAAEPVSPADFSLSVHHALAGLLSIARRAGAGHTSVAAGSDSFGYGLLEAATCLAAGDEQEILLVYFDEPLPADYPALSEGEDAFVAAFLLRPARGGAGDIALFAGPPDETVPRRSATEQARDFVGFLGSEAAERHSRGGRVQWRWRRESA